MSYISNLLTVFHQFTPNGQSMLLRELKANQKLLNKPFGYFDMVQILSKENKIKILQKDSYSPIKDIICFLTDKYLKELDVADSFKKHYKNIQNHCWIKKLTNKRGQPEYAMTKHFDLKKQKVFKILRESGMTESAKDFDKLNNPEDILNYEKLFRIDTLSKMYYSDSCSNLLKYILARIKFQLFKPKNKNFHMDYYFKWDIYIDIQKALLSQSKDKRVRRIDCIKK